MTSRTPLWIEFSLGVIRLTPWRLIEIDFKLLFLYGGGIFGRREIMLYTMVFMSLAWMYITPLFPLLIFGFTIEIGRIRLRGIIGASVRLGSFVVSWSGFFVVSSELVWGRIKNIIEVKTGGSAFIDEVFSYVSGFPVIGISFFQPFYVLCS